MVSGSSVQLQHSYFYSIDDRFGHGNTSYFTFFSEYNRPCGPAALEAVVMIILCLMSVGGNCLVLGFMYKSKRSLTVTKYFVCNLTIANILFASSSPFLVSIRLSSTWGLGIATCRLLPYTMYVCAIVSVWTMTVISIDRYIAIDKVIPYPLRMTPSQVGITCTAIWIVACAALSPIAIYFHVKEVQVENKTFSFCTLLWPYSEKYSYSFIFTLLAAIFGFAIPLAIISISYERIFKKLRASTNALAIVTRSNGLGIGGRMSHRYRDLAVVKRLALSVFLFVVMWMPVVVVIGIVQHDVYTEAMNISSSNLVWSIIIAYMNPVVNAFLYGSIFSEVRSLIQVCCRRGNKISSDSKGTMPQTNVGHIPTLQENVV